MSAETGVSDTRGDVMDELKQKNSDLVVVEACFHEANKRKQKGWKRNRARVNMGIYMGSTDGNNDGHTTMMHRMMSMTMDLN